MRPKVTGRFAPLADLEIEEYLCGDLSGERLERVEAAVRDDPTLKSYIAERQADQRAFYIRHPVLPGERGAPARRFGWAAAFGAASATVAVSLVLLMTIPGEHTADPTSSAVRARGTFKAMLAVRREGRSFMYEGGMPLRPGDHVRIVVESPEPGFLTVLGREPQGGGQGYQVYYDALQIHAGSFSVPDSLVLDEHIGPEQWVLLLADERRAAGTYVEKLRNGNPTDTRMAVIKFTKESTP